MILQSGYIVERKKVKHARINVDENKHVRLIIPEDFTEDDISRLILQKSSWIRKQLKFFKQEKMNPVKLKEGQILFFGKGVTPDFDINDQTSLDKWYRSEAKVYLIKRLNELSELHKIKYGKVFIRDTRTKWGNCSKDKNLSFNWRLIKAPKYVIDYVILHELTHIIILKHTQAFWLKLSLLYPDYKKSIDWLIKYGKSLF